MTITVFFFASLRDRLNPEQINIDFKENLTVGKVWYEVAFFLL